MREAGKQGEGLLGGVFCFGRNRYPRIDKFHDGDRFVATSRFILMGGNIHNTFTRWAFYDLIVVVDFARLSGKIDGMPEASDGPVVRSVFTSKGQSKVIKNLEDSR